MDMTPLVKDAPLHARMKSPFKIVNEKKKGKKTSNKICMQMIYYEIPLGRGDREKKSSISLFFELIRTRSN
jgi:hypothetical protein